MAATGAMTRTVRRAEGTFARVLATRIAIAGGALALWEAIARSGLLYEGVVPTLWIIGGALADLLAIPGFLDNLWPTPRLDAILRGLAALFAAPGFYGNLGTTAAEVGTALAIGGGAGLLAGLVLGASRFLGRAFEPYLYYLGPTPKIIFFPIMIMWFGTGGGSKVAMGAISCFFPVALGVAAGMRQIDRVLIRVGKSFRASSLQMALKIYLPAIRAPVVTSVRLGLGVAVIGVLLAETKLSNRGLGFMVIDAYARFDMPAMYALVIVIFVLAVGLNTGLTRLARERGRPRPPGAMG